MIRQISIQKMKRMSLFIFEINQTTKVYGKLEGELNNIY